MAENSRQRRWRSERRRTSSKLGKRADVRTMAPRSALRVRLPRVTTLPLLRFFLLELSLAAVVADPRCSPDADFQAQLQLLKERDTASARLEAGLLETRELVDRCLDEQPLLRLLFNASRTTEGWGGLLGRSLLAWTRWVDRGRPLDEPLVSVRSLEALRIASESLSHLGHSVLRLATRLAVGIVCSAFATTATVAASTEKELLDLAADHSARLAEAMVLLSGLSAATGAGVAAELRAPSSSTLDPSAAFRGKWLPSLGTPAAILQAHGPINVLPAVSALHRHRGEPERAFLVVYDLARSIGTTNCQLQAHLFSYIQVELVDAAEHCLVKRGAAKASDFLGAGPGRLAGTFGGALDAGGSCPEGLDAEAAKVASTAAPAASASAPATATAAATTTAAGASALAGSETSAWPVPEYRFDSTCCRRYHVLTALLTELGADKRPLRMVEIGVRHGRTSVELLHRFPLLELTGVDPYEGNDGTATWVAGRLSAFGPRAKLVRAKSHEVALSEVVNGPLDLLFIDGDHRFEAVVRDMNRWEPLVRPGGVIAGHDMFNPVIDMHVAIRYLWRAQRADGKHLARSVPIHVAADYMFFWYKVGGDDGGSAQAAATAVAAALNRSRSAGALAS
eukprot:TRINITY_DN7347_c0_g2_i1.p1 TRINITY_DN7347_c0_g2~~TRINITY_DN7347_c0_g2_i1.p1  ORF type:complete len:624 (-),score=134.49 TRINITY_DN7347_c0_g2_i1:354-2225(-)